MAKNHKLTKGATGKPTDNLLKSVYVNVTLSNGENGLYRRLSRYCKDTGNKEQETIRFATSQFLTRQGY